MVARVYVYERLKKERRRGGGTHKKNRNEGVAVYTHTHKRRRVHEARSKISMRARVYILCTIAGVVDFFLHFQAQGTTRSEVKRVRFFFKKKLLNREINREPSRYPHRVSRRNSYHC